MRIITSPKRDVTVCPPKNFENASPMAKHSRVQRPENVKSVQVLCFVSCQLRAFYIMFTRKFIQKAQLFNLGLPQFLSKREIRN